MLLVLLLCLSCTLTVACFDWTTSLTIFNIYVFLPLIALSFSSFFLPCADAGMALNHATGKMAILSQENASVWIGDFDIDAIDFTSDGGSVYHLPRDNHCEILYCNAEGVQVSSTI